jgi:hypothetical protein
MGVQFTPGQGGRAYAELIAACGITGSSGAIGGNIYGKVLSCVRNSAGNYTVTIAGPTPTEASSDWAPSFPMIQCTTAARHSAVVLASPNVWTVTTYDAAGAAADSDFNFLAFG